MKRRLRELYYPMTVPHPERLRKWVCKVSYGSARVISSGKVSSTYYAVPAPFPEAVGRRIAFVSDFHYRGTHRDRQLAALAAKRILEWKPDVLCFGGDLVTDAVELNTLPELLEHFRAAAPLMLAVPGNWERGKEWLPEHYWEEQYARFGIRFLSNTGLEHEGFYYYGCDDLAAGDPFLPFEWPKGLPAILLAHRPDTVIALDSHRTFDPVKLILCGHTHGGQIRIPFLGPIYASSRYGCRLAYGMFEHQGGNTRMIVTSGIGQRSFGLRIHCRREVVLVEFT